MSAERGMRCAEPEITAIIAIGSNMGDSPALLRAAMERLQSLSDRPIVKSSLYRSMPVDCPPGSPDFLNAVVRLQPRKGETPLSLLRQLQAMESEFGRQRGPVRNAPRPLDLDLIAIGDVTLDTPELTLPHPRAHERAFVLMPLAEIAPDYVLPELNAPASLLLERLPLGAKRCQAESTSEYF